MSERAESNGDPEGDPLSLDEILELLSNYQRRAIVGHLRDTPDDVNTIEAVIDFLRELERDRRGEPPGEDYLVSVLIHVHGPKLSEAGLVDYDVSSGGIRYHPNERVELALERIESIAAEFEGD